MWFTKQDQDKERLLHCPACAGPMKLMAWKTIQLDVCQTCHGLWFDYGEMKQIEESDTLENMNAAFFGPYESKPVATAMEAPERRCPLDQISLHRYEWYYDSGIVMDQCTECKGIFLDAGEIEGYVAYLKDLASHKNEPFSEAFETEMRLKRESMDAEVRDYADRVMDWGPFEKFMDLVFNPGSLRR